RSIDRSLVRDACSSFRLPTSVSILWDRRRGAKGDPSANVLRTFATVPFGLHRGSPPAGACRLVACGVRKTSNDEKLLRRRSIGRAGPAGDSGGGARGGGRRLEGGTGTRPAALRSTVAAVQRRRLRRSQGV